MPCCAPLAEGNQVRSERAGQITVVLGHPLRQALKLTAMGILEVLPAILRIEVAIRANRKTKICAIELFLNYHGTAEESVRLLGRQQFVLPRRSSAQPGEMRDVWKPKKRIISHGSGGSASPGNFVSKNRQMSSRHSNSTPMPAVASSEH